MLDALLLVILPILPTGVSALGIASEIIVMVHYYNSGFMQAFYATLVIALLPIVVLFLATLFKIEKAKEDDPETMKNNVLLRAVYYAFHIKMFHIYTRAVGGAVSQLCNSERENPYKNVYEATMIRRYLAFAGIALQLVLQMNVLFTRFIANNGLEPGDSYVMFAVAALVLSMGCSLAMHHCGDKIVDNYSHWSIPVRFISTLVIYFWKLALVLARGFACALFIHQFGIFVVIPVVLHGILVAVIFVACAKLAIDGFGGFMKFLILSYTQMYDVNDVYINEISGKTIVIVVYYIFRLVGDAGLIIPFFLLTNADSIKLLSLIIVFGGTVVGIVLRLIYYWLLHPKWR